MTQTKRPPTNPGRFIDVHQVRPEWSCEDLFVPVCLSFIGRHIQASPSRPPRSPQLGSLLPPACVVISTRMSRGCVSTSRCERDPRRVQFWRRSGGVEDQGCDLERFRQRPRSFAENSVSPSTRLSSCSPCVACSWRDLWSSRANGQVCSTCPKPPFTNTLIAYRPAAMRKSGNSPLMALMSLALVLAMIVIGYRWLSAHHHDAFSPGPGKPPAEMDVSD